MIAADTLAVEVISGPSDAVWTAIVVGAVSILVALISATKSDEQRRRDRIYDYHIHLLAVEREQIHALLSLMQQLQSENDALYMSFRDWPSPRIKQSDRLRSWSELVWRTSLYAPELEKCISDATLKDADYLQLALEIDPSSGVTQGDLDQISTLYDVARSSWTVATLLAVKQVRSRERQVAAALGESLDSFQKRVAR